MDSNPKILTPRERLLSQAGPLLRFLHSPEGAAFSDWLKHIRLRENKKLMEGDKTEEIFRAQGSVAILDLVLELEEDLLTYERGVASKEFKPLKEVANAVVR